MGLKKHRGNTSAEEEGDESKWIECTRIADLEWNSQIPPKPPDFHFVRNWISISFHLIPSLISPSFRVCLDQTLSRSLTETLDCSLLFPLYHSLSCRCSSPWREANRSPMLKPPGKFFQISSQYHGCFSILICCCYHRLAVNKKPAKPSRKSAKAAKDPNKPKRPASAFFVFMYTDSLISSSISWFFLRDPCSVWRISHRF